MSQTLLERLIYTENSVISIATRVCTIKNSLFKNNAILRYINLFIYLVKINY